MSWRNKVVWRQGMFMRPQHFQQQDRYIEHLIEMRCGGGNNHTWGFAELTLDADLARLGKLSIKTARGIFPDGTPFDIPEDYAVPLPLEIPVDTHEVEVFLVLPHRRMGAVEAGGAEGLARYTVQEYEARDTNADTDDVATLQIAQLRFGLLLESAHREAYTGLGVARVMEVRTDKNLVLDERYIPPVLSGQAAPALAGMIRELWGLLRHRGEALAGRVVASGQGGAAEIADFLLLQVVNRYEPVMAHLGQIRGTHPEALFQLFVAVAGELATFTRPDKRPSIFPAYQHDDLKASFMPIMAALREALSMVLEQKAISIPLNERRYGIRVGEIGDRNLLQDASFVLAVRAAIATEEIRRRFPAQAKLGPVEQIRELVNLQLPGISLRALPVAPRQIPYHAGFVYFELDRASEYWRKLDQSGGFAIHVGGEFPDLAMEFWAIRS